MKITGIAIGICFCIVAIWILSLHPGDVTIGQVRMMAALCGALLGTGISIVVIAIIKS